MKKGVIVVLVLAALLILPMVRAQTYSGVERFSDNVKLFFSGGDNKLNLALEIREKEVDSALVNTENGDAESAVKNLENAQNKLKIVQEKVSLENSEKVKTNVDEIVDKISKEENLPEEFDGYILEEEKTQLTAELTLKTYEYCKELAKEDYAAMLKEELCNPDTAAPGLEKELKELKNLQRELFVELMLDIRSCIDDPGTCNCDDLSDVAEKAKCEKMIALAVKCEYKDDKEACSQMKSLVPPAESFVPDFLRNLFKEKEYMIEYNIEHTEGVPPECYNENTKPECEQYMHMKETRAKCWDKEGNFNYEECGGPKAKEPTMQESIPQCYDENNNFLEEKCGKVTIIRNEEGLINYIVENEINKIIDEFENKSEQHTIDKGNLDVSEGNWTVDSGQMPAQDKVIEIKKEIDVIKTQIVERTFAPGTYDTGDSGSDVKNVVVAGGGGSGDGGLKTEVKTEVAGDGHGGNNVVDGGNSVTNTVEESGGSTVDSNEVSSGGGDSGSSGGGGGITGEVVGSGNRETFLSNFFRKMFGR